MDGGVLSVPSDRLIEFYDKCVECIQVGEPIFVVEQKTPIYNFFVDIDYKDSNPLSLDAIKMLVKIICDKVETMGGHECLVSIAKPKVAGHGKIKSGIHMNWPNFPINQENALYLREHIIGILNKVHSGVNWEQVVDEAVYKGSGFRMPWSHKKSRHGECHGKGCEVEGCSQGKITESPYLPVYMFKNKQLETLDYTEPCTDTLVSATIRSNAETSVVIPIVDKVLPVQKEKTKGAEEVVCSEVHARIQAFIRNNIQGQGQCDILKLLKSKDKFTCSTSSRFCANVDREHGSNHVWFNIYEGRISQKCFDENCKHFSGREHVLGPSILKLLYPDRNVSSFVSNSFNGGGGNPKKSRK